MLNMNRGKQIRKTVDEAQYDLNVYAREKGWKRV
jgi:hypothetical protein